MIWKLLSELFQRWVVSCKCLTTFTREFYIFSTNISLLSYAPRAVGGAVMQQTYSPDSQTFHKQCLRPFLCFFLCSAVFQTVKIFHHVFPELFVWQLHPPCNAQNINQQHFSHRVMLPGVRATCNTSPHVASLPVPALVALIRRGVPGRSLWRHRLTALLALLQPGWAPHTSVPSNPSLSELLKCPAACREVGQRRRSKISQSQIKWAQCASLLHTVLRH